MSASNDDELLEFSETLSMRSNAPSYGSALDLEEYIKIATDFVNTIKNSTSLRQDVLETWLLVDYSIRELLANLFKIKEFNSEDGEFDLRHELLPRSFERCADLLEKILNSQRNLDEDPASNYVTMSARFLFFYKKNYPEEFEKFLKIEQAYYKKYYPRLAKSEKDQDLIYVTGNVATVDFSRRNKYCVNKTWVDTLQGLDKKWFSLARRLNKARNVAAHSYDTNKILAVLGKNGPDAARQTKNECIEMLDKLLGLVQKSNEREA